MVPFFLVLSLSLAMFLLLSEREEKKRTGVFGIHKRQCLSEELF